MLPDTVVTWRWKPANGYRSKFGPETVNVLRRMVARHYPYPHKFVCVTDDPTGIDAAVTVLPDFGDFVSLPSPHDSRAKGHAGKYPSCYRRLRLFHPDADKWFGYRFVSLDLDVVITGDLTPLWDRAEDFVIWGDTNPTTLYNGSMVLLTAGARPQLWTEFDPATSPARAKASGNFGSDQGWISYRLGRGEAKWTQADGVYSYRNQVKPQGNRLPANARIVVFHGEHDPWRPDMQAIPWVRAAYQ